MDAYDLTAIDAERRAAGTLYREFLRVPSLSVGLYVLPAGAEDPQSPHTEDEVYHVVAGRATIRVAGQDQPVGPGSVVYVAAEVEHRFHTIEEDLTVLVFFAPAEYALAESNAPAEAELAP